VSTGYAEKGTSSGGYDTAAFWGYRKNNGQDNLVGTFGGGYIGSVSYGLLIHNGCKNVSVNNCKATGFNYVGLGVGFNGDYSPTDLGYLDSENVVFDGCYSANNYSAGFNFMASNGGKLVNSYVKDIGHPDALTSYTVCDPGYGVTCRGSSFSSAKNTVISNSTFLDCKRKGIDAHAGIGISIDSNTVKNCYVSGIYTSWSGLSQETSQVIISNNILDNNCLSVNNSLASIYVGGDSSSNTVGDTIVSGNVITNTGGRGIHSRYLSHVSIVGNKLRDSLSTGINSYIEAVAESSNTERDILITNNTIFSEQGSIPRGIQTSYIKDSVISGNNIIFEQDANIGLYAVACDNVNVNNNSVKLSTTGTPIAINQSNGLNYANYGKGGSAASFLTSSIKESFRVRDSFSFYVEFNGTTTPTVSGLTATNYLDTVITESTGFRINLKNLNTVESPTFSYQVSSSNLPTSGGTSPEFYYQRTANYAAIQVGIKATGISGSHIDASTLVSGKLLITVTL